MLKQHHWNVRRMHRTILVALLFIIILAALGGVVAYRYREDNSTQSSQDWQCQHAAQTTNPIMAENSCPGTDAWRPNQPFGPANAIEGFVASVSTNVGGSIKIYVSTTAAAYMFDVYRMGWYHGLGGRLLYSSPKLRGINQPSPTIDPVTRMVSCTDWRKPITLAIPTSWVSGVYIVKLLSSAGYIRYIPFVVRNDESDSPILFETAVFTYQAYNTWGGYGLYMGLDKSRNYTSNDRSYIVSFDRPYKGDGLGLFARFGEYSLLRWLEQKGYNVSYTTDVDTDMHGERLLQHRLFLAAGHDEYWSTSMRSNVTMARDMGVSLAFFSANNIYWHVRLESSPLGPDREVICYRYTSIDPMSSANPHEVTVRWRDDPVNEPENILLGEMYGGQVLTPAPLRLTTGAEPFLSSTGLRVGSTFPGLVGGEYDRPFDNGSTPSSLTILTSSPLQCIKSTLCTGTDVANATLYTAPSGAKVFDAGTFYWSWGLDSDSFDPSTKIPPQRYSTPAFQQFTANILTYLLS